MPRTSFRNLVELLSGAQIDATGEGPDVSQDIQLIYNVDDLSRYTYTTVGVGIFITPAVGENSVIEIEVRNPLGIVVQSAQGYAFTGAAGENSRAWILNAAQVITAAAVVVPGLVAGPAAVQSVVIGGSIAFAGTPAGAYRWSNHTHALQGLFVPGPLADGTTNFLTIEASRVGIGSSPTCIFRELGPGPPR